MKFGLITIHATQNYGSLLQAYSTYKAVESLGRDITLVDYRNAAIEEREKPITDRPISSAKDILKKALWGLGQKRKYEGILNFLKENVKISRRYTIENINEANTEFDVFVTGSDIVWGMNITGNDLTFFLDFAEKSKKKIAFSASIGTKWTENEQAKVKPLLEKYDYISVREQLAADWVQELTGKSVSVTCDPTMLWNLKFWQQFILEDYGPNERYVLIYAVNPDRRNIIDGIEYAKKHKIKAYFINFYLPVKGSKTVRPVTVQQWITLIAKSDAVFSASYHGLLFSLYFEKDVFFYNRGEKSRMISLAKELHIENREGNEHNIMENIPINYEFIREKLDQKREYSWFVLKSMLEAAKV